MFTTHPHTKKNKINSSLVDLESYTLPEGTHKKKGNC